MTNFPFKLSITIHTCGCIHLIHPLDRSDFTTCYGVYLVADKVQSLWNWRTQLYATDYSVVCDFDIWSVLNRFIELFTRIHQSCFTDTGGIVWLPHWQCGNCRTWYKSTSSKQRETGVSSLCSLAAPEGVILTTSGVTSDDNFVNAATSPFHWIWHGHAMCPVEHGWKILLKVCLFCVR